MLNSIEDDVLVVKFMTMQIPLHIHENGISFIFEHCIQLEKSFMHGIQYFMVVVVYTFTFMHYLFCFKL